jgi:UDP-2,3-diacylglucosamine hydrolase
MDEFVHEIAQLLNQVVQQGIDIYWMPGNRDFLMGKKFLQISGLKYLPDPSIIILPGIRLMLAHGDAYCLNDHAHQVLRALTRNKIFYHAFLILPASWRIGLGGSLRRYSQNKKSQAFINEKRYRVEQKPLFKQMLKFGVFHVIYGHVHSPEIKSSEWKGRRFYEYVLSDWDIVPTIYGYHMSKGLHQLSQSIFDS